MKYIKAGNGVNVGNDFARLKENTPIELSDEHAKPHCAIGYIDADPDSSLGFMRNGASFGPHKGKIRVHVKLDAIAEAKPANPEVIEALEMAQKTIGKQQRI